LYVTSETGEEGFVMTVHLSKRILVAMPLVVVAVAAAAWGGGALASSSTDPADLTVCVSGGGSVSAVSIGGSCKQNQTQYQLLTSDTVASLTSQVTTLEGQVSTLQSDLSALQSLLDGVTRPDPNTLLFSGVNLQVVNGTGQTDGTPNGLGNLILGYNTGSAAEKTGSHDLVIGDDNTYTNTSGIVSGNGNRLSGQYALASGGGNTASGDESFATGGGNLASGVGSVATGGSNLVSGVASFATGFENTVSGDDSFATGDGNTASGDDSFGSGEENTASGGWSFVGGGIDDPTAGPHDPFTVPGICAYILTTLFGHC
jgi:hypothetical protein